MILCLAHSNFIRIQQGETPYHCAVWLGIDDTIKFFEEVGADDTIKNVRWNYIHVEM